jgi:hypothetical protein
VVLVVVAFAAAAIVAAATRLGVGVSPDSVSYLSAAEAIASGRGVMTVVGDAWRPLTQFPPLFPLLASMGPLVDVEATVWARALNVSFFSFLISGTSLIVYRASRGSLLAAILAAGVLLASDDLLSAYCMAWSEPLFLVLLLGFAWALAESLARQRMSVLVGAGLFAAAASLTRYAGVSIVATGALALLALGGGSFLRRIRDATLFVILAAGPIALWFVRNAVLAGNATSRPFVFHPLPFHVYAGGAENVWNFVTQGWLVHGFPRNIHAIAGAAFVLAFVVAGAIARRPEDRLLRVIALFVIVHVVTLAAAGAVQDFILFDERQLLPLFVTGTVLVVTLLSRWTAGRRFAHVAMAVLILVHIGAGASPVSRFIGEARVTGLGYNSMAWKSSPLMAQLRSLPAGVAVRSNADDAIYFLTGRMAAPLPMKYDPPSTLTNPRYAQELATIGRNGGLVAWFATVPWRRYAPTREELLAHPGLREMVREVDGSLFVPR